MDIRKMATDFCNSQNFQDTLTQAVKSDKPFERFQTTFRADMHANLQKKLSDQSSDRDKTLLSHRIIANQTSTKRLGVLEDLATNNQNMTLLNNIKKFKTWIFLPKLR